MDENTFLRVLGSSGEILAWQYSTKPENSHMGKGENNSTLPVGRLVRWQISAPRETPWACSFSHRGKREYSESLDTPCFRGTSQEPHFCLNSPRMLRESAYLDHLGANKNKEKLQGLKATTTQISTTSLRTSLACLQTPIPSPLMNPLSYCPQTLAACLSVLPQSPACLHRQHTELLT